MQLKAWPEYGKNFPINRKNAPLLSSVMVHPVQSPAFQNTRGNRPLNRKMVFERYEYKYLMTRRQQEAVLAAMAPYMVADEYSHSSIRNLYLDTPGFRLIRRSLEKPVYKEKLRVRSYGRAAMGEEVFVELKKKYRSVVYKRRLALPQEQALACLAGEAPWPGTQIGGELAYAVGFYQDLAPAVFLSYERDAYRGRENAEFRVTFDREIRYRRQVMTLDSDPWGSGLLDPNQVLMELKVAGAMPLWMARILSEQKIFQTSFSKYGSAYRQMLLEKQQEVRRYA